MDCPHCGAAVAPGSSFCHRCRKRVVAANYATAVSRASADPAPRVTPTTPPRPAVAAPVPSDPSPILTSTLPRPGILTALAVLDLLGGALCSFFALILTFALFTTRQQDSTVILVVMVGVYGLLGGLALGAGFGVLRLRRWGRNLQMTLAVIGLPVIPVGTLIGILILVYFSKPGVKVLFSEKLPDELTRTELADLQTIQGTSGAVVAVVVLVTFFVVVAGIGIVAAIAIPSLLRARVAANEASAIGRLREVASAEQAYQGSNAGLYDRPECLATPSRCIPGYTASSLTFLSTETAATELHHGYRFSFVPGVPGSAPEGFAASPTSLQSYIYVAVPVTQNTTGIRSFCADSTGTVCAIPSGGAIEAGTGSCPAGCTPLR